MSGCPICSDTGFVEVKQEGYRTPKLKRCSCKVRRAMVRNMDRGMPGLSKAPDIDYSPLEQKVHDNLWITCSREWLQAHLKCVAKKKPVDWGFLVVSDAQLITAWLANIAVSGAEIFDPDAMAVTLSHYSLEDLVLPPTLLVVYLGVKVARNSALPEVVLEAINLRLYEKKPTWVVDQPLYPLDINHMAYSATLADVLKSWEHVIQKGATKGVAKTSPNKPTLGLGKKAGLIAQRFAPSSGSTRSLEIPPTETPKSSRKRVPRRPKK